MPRRALGPPRSGVSPFVFRRRPAPLLRFLRSRILGLCVAGLLSSGFTPTQGNVSSSTSQTREALPRRAWEKAKAQRKGPGPTLLVVFPKPGDTFTQDTIRFGGCTEPGCEVVVNGIEAKVYSTGAFAGMTQLHPGRNTVVFRSTRKGKSTTAEIRVNGPPREAPLPKAPLSIDSGPTLLPNADLDLLPGDTLHVRFRGSPGQRAWFQVRKGARHDMRELVPGKDAVKIPGIYEGEYVIQSGDSFVRAAVTVTLEGKVGKRTKTISARASGRLTTDRDAVCGYARADDDDTGLYHNLSAYGRITSVAKGTLLELRGRHGVLRRVRLGEDAFAWVYSKDLDKISAKDALPLPFFRRIGTERDSRTGAPVLLVHTEWPGKKRTRLPLPFRVETHETGSTVTLTVWGLRCREAIEAPVQERANQRAPLYEADLPLPDEPSLPPGSRGRITRVRYRQMDEMTAVFDVSLASGFAWGYDARFEGGVLRLVLKTPPTWTSAKHDPVQKKQPLAGVKIVLDAGHGGSDTGAVGNTGLYESDVILEIVRRLRLLLVRAGAQVELTREDDHFVSLQERSDRIARSGADLFLSVHNNSIGAGEDPLAISGPRSFYHYGHGILFAKHILAGLAEETGFPWQSTNVHFHVFRPIRMCTDIPGALTEVLFLSNPEDEALLLQTAFLDNVAEGLYKGMLAFAQRQPLPPLRSETKVKG
jgi:N-acetylmuramoyl-L-alanine amidase